MADNIPNLGEVPSLLARRDAIHVSVAPVKAGEDLVPGQHVGVMDDVAYNTKGRSFINIGVVDPFISRKTVYKGTKFWLFLYPGIVTSIQHYWTHPSFDDEVYVKLDFDTYDEEDDYDDGCNRDCY